MSSRIRAEKPRFLGSASRQADQLSFATGRITKVSLRAAALAAGLLLFGTPALLISQESARQITTESGIFSVEQAARGEERYRSMCARCHGRDLRALYAEVPGLTSYAFLANWPGRPVSELFETIRYTMPMIARQTMPRGRTDQKEFLDVQTSIDLAAYILSFNRFPAGETELPADVDYLRQILITTPEPMPPGAR